jgi:hypothetical protein
MRRFLPRLKPLKLRVLLATMLSLHVGFAAAVVPGGMVNHEGHSGATPAPGVAMTTLASTCHLHADSTSRHCCVSSDCHCPGHCAMAATTQVSSYASASFSKSSPVNSRGALPPPIARDLRPPIAG